MANDDEDSRCPILRGGCAVGPMRKIKTIEGGILGMNTIYGTIGAIVSYRKQPMILSCFHVLAPDGDFIPGDPIGQPPPIPADPTGRVVATLHEEVSFGSGNVDAALAIINTDIPVMDSGIRWIDSSGQSIVTPTGFATELEIEKMKAERTPVMKMGIRTRSTRGFIAAVGQPATVDYPRHRHQKKLRLIDQLYIANDTPGKKFSKEADSGSLVISKTTNGKILIVGMLVAGGDINGTQYSVVTPIHLIRAAYQSPFGDLKLLG